jgi:hypothetical protein
METIFRHGQAIDRSQIIYYRAVRTEHCFKIAASGAPIPDFNICDRVGELWSVAGGLRQDTLRVWPG